MADAAAQVQIDAQVEELKSLVTDEMMAEHGEIIQLLFESSSLNMGEKKYWLQLMPLMGEEHMNQLRTILAEEKEQMDAIDKKFEKTSFELDKATIESREEYKEQREKAAAMEKQHREEDEEKSEELLSSLGDL